MMLRRNVRGIS